MRQRLLSPINDESFQRVPVEGGRGEGVTAFPPADLEERENQ